MYAVCHMIIIASVFRRTGQLLKLRSVPAYIPSASQGWPSTGIHFDFRLWDCHAEDPGVHGNTDGADLRQSGTIKANIKLCAFYFHNHNSTKVM